MRKYKAKLVIKLKSLVFSMYYKIISKIKGKLYCTSFFFVMMNRLSWAVDSKMRKPFIVWIHSFFVRILAIFPIICFWRICAEFWSDRQVNSAAINFKFQKLQIYCFIRVTTIQHSCMKEWMVKRDPKEMY